MLRNLVSKFGRRSKGKSRRGRRGIGFGSALSVECLEARMVLSATVPVVTAAPDAVTTSSDGDQQFLFLARFSDVTDPENLFSISQYSYTIDWGDGSLVAPAQHVFPIAGAFDVNMGLLIPGITYEGHVHGSHTFDTAGQYTVTVSVTETDVNGIVSTPVSDSMVLTVYDRYEVEPGESQFHLSFEAPVDEETGAPTDVAEGNPIHVGFRIPESFDPEDVAGWTISWGDETVFYANTPDSVSHIYDNVYLRFGEAPSQAVRYVSGAVHLDGDDSGIYGIAPGFLFDRLFDPIEMPSIAGPESIAAGATYTLDLTYDDVPGDFPLVWQINWGDGPEGGIPVYEVFVGNPSSVTHAYVADGTYNIEALVYVNEGYFLPAFTTVQVGVLPTPDAGGPYATFADAPITLTGSVDDPTGLTFIWDLDDDDVFGELGEVGETVIFDPAGVAGMQTVRLKVTDGVTESEASEATIEVLADGALVIGDELVVVGDSVAGDTVLVSLDGTTLTIETAAGTTTFDATTFGDIRIRTGAGNDVVVIDASITNTVYIDGGEGNDLLVGGGGRSIFDGGAGNDFLYGAAGDDILLGGTGNDQIFGGGGNDSIGGGEGVDVIDGGSGLDLLIGGQDNDLVSGGGGEDILVGGWTIHDADAAALDLIMATWTNGASFNSRINVLTGAGGLLQAGSAVFDDDDLDILIGGGGRDLVFGDINPFDGAFDLIALSLAQDRLIAVN